MAILNPERIYTADEFLKEICGIKFNDKKILYRCSNDFILFMVKISDLFNVKRVTVEMYDACLILFSKPVELTILTERKRINNCIKYSRLTGMDRAYSDKELITFKYAGYTKYIKNKIHRADTLKKCKPELDYVKVDIADEGEEFAYFAFIK